MTDEQPPDPLTIPWYAMPEDTIGGWCVMTTPDPPSASKGYYIADFLAGEAIARHVADLHNATLRHLEITTNQAAVLLGVTRPTVIRMLDKGLLPYRVIGPSHRRIPQQAVLDYIKQHAPWLEGPQ